MPSWNGSAGLALRSLFKFELLNVEEHMSKILVKNSVFILMLVLLLPSVLMAQEIRTTIMSAINNMQIVLNLLIVGLLAWSGFLLAKGDGSGVQRIIYCVIGLIVVNSADAILRFFVRV